MYDNQQLNSCCVMDLRSFIRPSIFAISAVSSSVLNDFGISEESFDLIVMSGEHGLISPVKGDLTLADATVDEAAAAAVADDMLFWLFAERLCNCVGRTVSRGLLPSNFLEFSLLAR